MRKVLVSAFAWPFLAGAALAQTGLGQGPAWNIAANPTASAASQQWATITQMLDGAFCNTNGAMLARGASVWACQTTLPTALFPALTGDVTNSAGALATTIAANAVSFAKFAQGALNTTLCNPTGSTANFQACTPGQMSANLCLPNIQVFTSGTAATYTVPTCNSVLATYLEVEFVGAGGSGGGSGTGGGVGQAGGNSTFVFNSVTYTANGGGAGQTGTGAAAGAGGTATGCDDNIPGGSGGAGWLGSAAIQTLGAIGGGSFYGGAGAPGTNNVAGGSGATNTGSGGGAAGGSTAQVGASGGGAGGFCRKLIVVGAVTTGTYTIGTGGIAGTGAGNGFNGGGGAAGRLRVIARWQ